MKRLLYIQILFLLFGTTTLNAENKRVYEGDIRIESKEFRKVGDSLRITVDIDLYATKIQSKGSVELIPILIAPGHYKQLPAVVIKGKRNHKVYKRDMALMNRAEKEFYDEHNTDFVVKTNNRDVDSEIITYSQTIPYESWMEDAHLDLREICIACGVTTTPPTLTNVADMVIMDTPYLPSFVYSYIQPEVEEFVKRNFSHNTSLTFDVSKTSIKPELGNNQHELDRVSIIIGEIYNNDAITIKKINIVGLASPEGQLSFNKRLSEGRAHALQNYIQSRYKILTNLFQIEFGGEDWDGLAVQVRESEMDYKNEVLDIIENVPVLSGREKELMILAGGNPYRYMLTNMFPSLRRAAMHVEYEVKAYAKDEAVEVYKTRPQDLSLNAYYQVANTHQPGTDKFTKVFERALDAYPNDDVALLNAAAAALNANDTELAEKYLKKIKTPSPEYHNNVGISLTQTGHYADADRYFRMAIEEGSADAEANLQELIKIEKNRRQLGL